MQDSGREGGGRGGGEEVGGGGEEPRGGRGGEGRKGGERRRGRGIQHYESWNSSPWTQSFTLLQL